MSYNPYAIYVHCDGAMNYDSKNTGGIGFAVLFPESIGMEEIQESIGSFSNANIERLEIKALIEGIRRIYNLYKSGEIQEACPLIVITDRFNLCDSERTNAWKIDVWRKNKWHGHEGNEIKNSDLLDELDKLRSKIVKTTACTRISIEFKRRKFNKGADKLAKKAKSLTHTKVNIGIISTKVGKRKFNGGEVPYGGLIIGTELLVHVFKKDPLKKQWDVSAEIGEGKFLGRIISIYVEDEIERKISRHHFYRIKLKNVHRHHATIYDEIEEVVVDIPAPKKKAKAKT